MLSKSNKKQPKLVSKNSKQENTVIKIGDVEIGGNNFVIIGGPCAIESKDQIIKSAIMVKKAGGHILRGGAYKPRTSPYDFQGLEEQGLKYMFEAKQETGLKIISEVIDIASLEACSKYVDILQIGARNMQNFSLLKHIGKSKLPVMLKRGLSATIDEWLNAAEYIMSEGNSNIILCERGIRTYETSTRNTLDISAIPVIKSKSHLPIIVDPSHATGVREFVTPLAKASMVAGADGVMIEMHPDPSSALSDGQQSLNENEFSNLCQELRELSKVAKKGGLV